MGLLDELRDHDEVAINEIVLPLMNVSRRLPDNTVNINEPNQQTISMTSAGTKTSFAYDKLIDVFETSIINPKAAFCFGCDYRVPVMHGLLDKNFIDKLRMSPSYNEESFARELTLIALFKFLKLLGSAQSLLHYNKICKDNCECLKRKRIA